MSHNMPRRIVFTRHPQCIHNVDAQSAIKAGIANRDSALTDLGVLQRDITAEYLRREFPDIEVAWCSTYSRTSAIPVAAGFSRVLKSFLLDERDMGVWHRHTREEVLQMYPGEEDYLNEVGYYHYEAPGGESCLGVERRLNRFLSTQAFCASLSTVYISGHGIAGLCLRRILTGASLEDWHSWGRPKNASVTVFERSGSGYVCSSYNVAPWEGVIDQELLKRKSVEA
jgi:broad specificity phosphatase PhoE